MRGSPTFLSATGPRLFTIPSGEDFQAALVRGVLAVVDHYVDPFALHDIIILVPTRRAVRSLSQAFLQVVGADKATLLPQILPMGDVDADEPPFIAGHMPAHIPAAMSSTRRMFALAQIVMHRAQVAEHPVSLTSALAEAAAISKLIDTAAYEGIDDFSLASEAFAAFLTNQPEHIQQAARFLEIISTYWPQVLRDEGVIDASTRQAKMLETLSDEWVKDPTTKTVIAAGSTGSQKATAELLRVISGLPNGCVVLPGLDQELDDPAWSQVGKTPGHPQYGMARLLGKLGAGRAAVGLWPQSQLTQQQACRRRIINEALTPAEITSDWLNRLEKLAGHYSMDIADLMQDGLDGLSLIEAKNEDEEAMVLALAIRQALADPTKTTMLVTPDRLLARRVRAALQCWSIEVDDSAGIPLPEDRVGAFLKLVLNWWIDPGDPSALLAMLVHPLCSIGLDRTELLALVRTLDIDFLHAVRTYDDLAALADIVGKTDHKLAGEITTLLLALHELVGQSALSQQHNIAEFAEVHANLAEQLARNDQLDGAAILWCGKGGEQAGTLIRSLIDESEPAGQTDLSGYRRIFDFFAGQISVRPRRPKGGRARILGPLEARQQTADLVLLGGLDEGTWPASTVADPFLPRALIKQLKLPDPEHRLGLSAHDFSEIACKDRVLLTRSGRRDGTPTIASRWVWRLKTLCRAALGEDWQSLLQSQTDYLAIARQMITADHFHPVGPPEPRPPISTRPKGLYVTRIKTLIRNPYAIYGQKILGLKKLDEIGREPGPRERGNALHTALERWHDQPQPAGQTKQIEHLANLITVALGEFGFQSSDMAIERPAANRIAEAYLEWQAKREASGHQIFLLEKEGAMKVETAHGDITISAKTDRIDRHDQNWTVLDYKTGTPSSTLQVLAGFDPQLPLTAAILNGGGFATHDIEEREVEALLYLKLSGGQKPLEEKYIRPAKDSSLSEVIDQELQRTIALFETFADPNTPYLCQPRAQFIDQYSDFDHLARRSEWSALLDGEE